MSNQPITFQGIAHLYHYFNNEKQDLGNALLVRELITELSYKEMASSKDEKIQRFSKAINHLNSIISVLKEKYPDSDSPYTGFDYDVRILKAEGIDLISQLKEIKLENLQALSDLIKRIHVVVKNHFSHPEQVETVLNREADRQNRVIRSARLCDGFIGLYEMVMLRPNLQYHITNGGVDRNFLSFFPRPVVNLLRSFSENAGVSQSEGLANLRALIDHVYLHRQSMLDLYPPGSDTGIFIAQLFSLKGNSEGQKRFYERLKQASVAQCAKSSSSSAAGGVDWDELQEFFNAKAKDISAKIPVQMKGDTSQVGRHLAQGWQTQQDHGQGARLQGVEGPVRNMEDMFGEGIHEGVSIKSKINPFSDVSLEQIQNATLRARMKKLCLRDVHNFYEQHQLPSKAYLLHQSVVEEVPLDDPIQAATVAASLLIDYQLDKLRREREMLFDFDETQKEQLKPGLAKEIILFGLQHDIFAPTQIFVLMFKFGLLGNEEINVAITEAVQRFQSRIEVERNRAYEEAASELRNMDPFT